MKTKGLLGCLVVTAAFFLSTTYADHMSPWGPGYANMPNDIRNTRIDTWLEDDNEAFRSFVIYGAGADSINRYLEDDEAISGAQLGSTRVTEELVAVLNPLPSFQGRGKAKYKVFDDTSPVARVLNIHLRLRLVRNNGAVANPSLGLTEANASSALVTAYLSRDGATDEPAQYAACGLVFDEFVYSEDGIACYATYLLSLREHQTGVVAGDGLCIDNLASTGFLPSVQALDIVDIGVVNPGTGMEVVPVLMGSF